MDQADTLRMLIETEHGSGSANPKLIAVTSGKGGVGKTNVAANLGLALQRQNLRVGILDADLGLANMDVLLGLRAKYNIQHVLLGERRLAEVLLEGPEGMMILPAGSGVVGLTDLGAEQWRVIFRELGQMGRNLDLVLIDTGAGISENVIHFLRMAQEILLVVSPEPTSIIDAYAVMKVMSNEYGHRQFRLLVNMANSAGEAREVFSQLCRVTDRFLEVDIVFQGFVFHDAQVRRAVRRHQAVLEAFPHCKASRSFQAVAQQLWGAVRIG